MIVVMSLPTKQSDRVGVTSIESYYLPTLTMYSCNGGNNADDKNKEGLHGRSLGGFKFLLQRSYQIYVLLETLFLF